MSDFMFATGIENSIPKIKHGTVRVDEMDVCGHYKHWRTDFDCVEDLGTPCTAPADAPVLTTPP